jgi:hypothetical protein
MVLVHCPRTNNVLAMYWVSTSPFAPSVTAAQRYNQGFKRIKRGSAVVPYPDPATIYRRSAIADPGDDMFEDIYMGDM